jgi:hypothetical protein
MAFLSALWKVILHHYKAITGFLAVVVFIALVGNEPTIWLANQIRGLLGFEQNLGPAAATPAPSTPAGPRIELTAKGYALDSSGLYSALAAGQYEDAELFSRAGIKFRALPDFDFHIDPSSWSRLNEAGIIADSACTEIHISTRDEGFLERILAYQNSHILETSCSGAYLSRFSEAYTKHLSEMRALAEKRNELTAERQRIEASSEVFVPQCRSELNTIFSAENVGEVYRLCRSLQSDGKCNNAKIDELTSRLQSLRAKAESHTLYMDFQWSGSLRPLVDLAHQLYFSYVAEVGGGQSEARYAEVMDETIVGLCERFVPLLNPELFYVAGENDLADADEFYEKFSGFSGVR